MAYNFDNVPSRRDTFSMKWDHFASDVIPLWVADMDFPTAPEIIRDLHQRVDHGVFGYGRANEAIEQLIVNRCRQHYEWEMKPEWLVWLPNLVTGLHLCTRSFVAEHESVICPTPVYHHFPLAAKQSKRALVSLRWTEKNGRLALDFDGLEQELKYRDGVLPRLLMLCNPHNPNGHVFSRDELKELEQFCQRHNLIVCSDEIHCDLILDRNARHTPYAAISEFARDHSVTLMSASKAFNLGGFCSAYAVIPNPQLRERFNQTREGIVPPPDSLGYVAATAAYRSGGQWHTQLLDYLRGNHDYLLHAINEIPGLSMKPLQATYLAWIDVSRLKLDDPQKFFLEAGVGVSPGSQFGDNNYVRLNFACSRSLLEQAVTRMATALVAHSGAS